MSEVPLHHSHRRRSTTHSVEYKTLVQISGHEIEGPLKFRPPSNPGSYVNKLAPHEALKSITRGKVTFDERVVLYRVYAAIEGVRVSGVGVWVWGSGREMGLNADPKQVTKLSSAGLIYKYFGREVRPYTLNPQPPSESLYREGLHLINPRSSLTQSSKSLVSHTIKQFTRFTHNRAIHSSHIDRVSS